MGPMIGQNIDYFKWGRGFERKAKADSYNPHPTPPPEKIYMD